jgi:sporulation protein YhbH
MTIPIEQDSRRFRQIVRGKVRQNLRQYISNGELIGRRGKDLVSIPIPEIQLPYFRFGGKGKGVSQGDGDVGTPIGTDGDGAGGSKAGDQPGTHILEVELTMEELAQILGEELALPRIQPKSKNNVEGQIIRYTGMRRVGPEGLRYFKRTYREALKRQLASGTYNRENPAIIPIRDDKRYRSWKEYPRPDSNAVILYMMDVSGSMSDRKKELVRLTAFWIDTWLQAHYKNVITRYIVHDTNAYEVDSQTFYTLRESGGTRISSAYDMCHKIICNDFNPDAWNLYAFHFSDGENFDSEDDQHCLRLLEEDLLPKLNQFCYGQVRSYQGQQFIDTLEKIEDEKMTSAKINEDDDIYTAIKIFLGKGL